MRWPFVRRSELEGALIREERLQTQITRQKLYELHVPMISSLMPNDYSGDSDNVYNLEGSYVVITGPEDAITKVRKTLDSKTTHERDIVQLMLDLHQEKFSLDSDRFLRVLNIDPTPFEKKYWKGKKK